MNKDPNPYAISDINEKGKDGYTPLIRASISGDLEAVKFLVENGATLDECSQDGWFVKLGCASFERSAIFYACKHRQNQVVFYLLQCGAKTILKYKDSLSTFACQCGNLEVLQHLVNTGNSPFYDWKVGLQSAIKYGHLHVLQYLFSRFGHTKKYHTFLFREAVRCSQKNIVQFFITETNVKELPDIYEEALRTASIDGDLDMVRCLVEAGADVNAPDEHGWTALRCSVELGHRFIPSYLVENGAFYNLDAFYNVLHPSRDILDSKRKEIRSENRNYLRKIAAFKQGFKQLTRREPTRNYRQNEPLLRTILLLTGSPRKRRSLPLPYELLHHILTFLFT